MDERAKQDETEPLAPVTPGNSFDELRESPATRCIIAAARITVLVIAIAAAVIAAWIGLTRKSPAGSDVGINRTISAADATGFPVNPAVAGQGLVGTFAGEFRSDDQTAWLGALSMAGDSGLLVYPANGCQVVLSLQDVVVDTKIYAAQSLNNRCSAGGHWELTTTFSGNKSSVKAVYIDGSHIANNDTAHAVVTATLEPHTSGKLTTNTQ